jgi:hypothetical protein
MGDSPKAPKNDSEWFERKVSELKAELEKLPSARAARAIQGLRDEKEQAN